MTERLDRGAAFPGEMRLRPCTVNYIFQGKARPSTTSQSRVRSTAPLVGEPLAGRAAFAAKGKLASALRKRFYAQALRHARASPTRRGGIAQAMTERLDRGATFPGELLLRSCTVNCIFQGKVRPSTTSQSRVRSTAVLPLPLARHLPPAGGSPFLVGEPLAERGSSCIFIFPHTITYRPRRFTQRGTISNVYDFCKTIKIRCARRHTPPGTP